MPLVGNHANDVGLETSEGPVCIHDVVDGKIKNPEDIFEGGVRFFMAKAANGDRDLADRVTRRNMTTLPYWQRHPFAGLNGPEATDQEFGEVMGRLT